MADSKKSRGKAKRQPPVSLHPLEPEGALAGLLQVKPEDKGAPPDEQPEQETEPDAEEPN